MLPTVNGYKAFAVTQPFHLLLGELWDMTVISDYDGLRNIICLRDSAKPLNCKSSELYKLEIFLHSISFTCEPPYMSYNNVTV